MRSTVNGKINVYNDRSIFPERPTSGLLNGNIQSKKYFQ